MKRVISLYLYVVVAIAACADNVVGVVVDESGTALPYSTVRVKHRKIAVLGDSVGKFDLSNKQITAKDTLVASYMGYRPREIAVSQLTADMPIRFRLEPQATPLREISVYPTKPVKSKTKKQGKHRSGGLFKCTLDGDLAGECFGYEFHAKKNKRLVLDKVGFFYCEGERQMEHMTFRINVYDMSKVTKSPTKDFVNILTEPIYFTYTLTDKAAGKFEYALAERIILPKDAMVEIEFLENLKENIFWYKSNVVGKRTWNKSLIAGYWDQNPFAAPFFIECIEIRE